MPEFTVKSGPEGADSAQVDDVLLDPTGDITEEQAQRLRDAGVVFEGDEEQAEPAQAEEPHRRRRAAQTEGEES